ncbi:hypothetical protein ABT033_31355 [Streptomyces pharetrae]|uniref:hypothetical protein n=1 Tax=Streptomyces pharetrae TaxID=291370 RepID=UPI003362B42E
MSETRGRDWTRMTPDDFDREAALRLDVGAGPAAIPAVPDECGTAPLFGDETAGPRRRGPERRPAVPVDQDSLF